MAPPHGATLPTRLRARSAVASGHVAPHDTASGRAPCRRRMGTLLTHAVAPSRPLEVTAGVTPHGRPCACMESPSELEPPRYRHHRAALHARRSRAAHAIGGRARTAPQGQCASVKSCSCRRSPPRRLHALLHGPDGCPLHPPGPHRRMACSPAMRQGGSTAVTP